MLREASILTNLVACTDLRVDRLVDFTSPLENFNRLHSELRSRPKTETEITNWQASRVERPIWSMIRMTTALASNADRSIDL